MLTVIPEDATSVDNDLLHPTSEERIVFDMARFAIGCTTPDEATVSTLPQPASFISATQRFVISITRISMVPICASQRSVSGLSTVPGGGPPVLLTRISMPPSLSLAAAYNLPAESSSDRSATTWSAVPGPALLSSFTTVTSLSSTRLEIMTFAPSSQSFVAMPRPRPWLDARTSACFPLIPRSMFTAPPDFFLRD